jgi:hypothetical protein
MIVEEEKRITPDYIDQLTDRRVTKDYKDEWHPILKYRKEDGEAVSLAAKTELVVVAGDKKSRKSMLLSSILASRFQEVDRKKALGFELELEHEPILYFDTEMPMGRIVRNRKKYLSIIGLEEDVNFHQYSLRGFSPNTMIHQIQGMIEKMVREGNPPGLLIIDQVADLLTGRDENDKQGASDLIDYLNDWIGLCGCMIIVTIHLNRGGFNTNGKVGSLIDQKADCGFRLNLVDKTWETELTQSLSREKRMPDIVFTHDSWGLPLLIEEKMELNNKKYF